MSNPNDVKVSLNINATAAGLITAITVSDESKVRIIVSNAASNSVILVKGRIIGQDDWDVLKTLSGNCNVLVNVSTYDLMELEATTFASASNFVKVVASSFNQAGGSTSIDAPSGNTIEDAETLHFTSSDGTVSITTDNATSTIDIKANAGAVASSKYIKTLLLSDWIGPSANEYILTIPFSFHAVANPSVTCYEDNGATLDQVLVAMNVDSSYNITLVSSATPDTRFAGKIIIE